MPARLLFCGENAPENEGHISGAQDAIGICLANGTQYFYYRHYRTERMEDAWRGRRWPSRIVVSDGCAPPPEMIAVQIRRKGTF